ncbi:unnamed protein product [Calicophoron daubneyi]|uniref:NAD dependent epimerase/dehydratase n=1 Tax=Calicophoron daubneyi TaxID=300641 RepID=A0AAV2SZM0_CALDB
MSSSVIVPQLSTPGGQEDMPVVFVVGLNKTGTSCVKSALEIIFEGKLSCLHISDFFPTKIGTQMDKWFKLSNEQNEVRRRDELKNLLRHYNLASGFPITPYIKDLLELYPAAKIILTVRDAETWLAKCRCTSLPRSDKKTDDGWVIRKMLTLLRFRQPEQLFVTSLRKAVGEQVNIDHDLELLKAYTKWNERVEQTVPKDRLLVYNIKQGWKPLCDFLNVPVPPVLYPDPLTKIRIFRWSRADRNIFTNWIFCFLTYILIGLTAFSLVK